MQYFISTRSRASGNPALVKHTFPDRVAKSPKPLIGAANLIVMPPRDTERSVKADIVQRRRSKGDLGGGAAFTSGAKVLVEIQFWRGRWSAIFLDGIDWRSSILIEHDLFGKPVPTFPGHALTEATMRRIVLLWLILTPIWIAFSFYASVSKIAFLPPAFVVVAVVLHWLHKHFVVAVAGEPEPRAKPVGADPWPSRSEEPRPVARPSRGLLRPALIAVGIGACCGGAAAAFVHAHRPVANTSAAALATEPNAASSVQTEAVKPQSAAAEAKSVQTEAMKPQSAGAEAEIQDNATSSHNADAKRADAQISEGHTPSSQSSSVQTSSSSPRCNVSLCETYYQSFRASDCTYQPYSGPRQYCGR
jgi:hypothetical protein